MSGRSSRISPQPPASVTTRPRKRGAASATPLNPRCTCGCSTCWQRRRWTSTRSCPPGGSRSASPVAIRSSSSSRRRPRRTNRPRRATSSARVSRCASRTRSRPRFRRRLTAKASRRTRGSSARSLGRSSRARPVLSPPNGSRDLPARYGRKGDDLSLYPAFNLYGLIDVSETAERRVPSGTGVRIDRRPPRRRGGKQA